MFSHQESSSHPIQIVGKDNTDTEFMIVGSSPMTDPKEYIIQQGNETGRIIGQLTSDGHAVIHLNSYEEKAKEQFAFLLDFLKNHFKDKENWVLAGDFNINLNNEENRKWIDNKLKDADVKLVDVALETPIKRQRSEKLAWNPQVHKGGEEKTDIKNIILSLSVNPQIVSKQLADISPKPAIKMGADGLDHDIASLVIPNKKSGNKTLFVSLSNLPTVTKSSGLSDIFTDSLAGITDLRLRKKMMDLMGQYFPKPEHLTDAEFKKLTLKDFMKILSPAFDKLGRQEFMRRLSENYIKEFLASREYFEYLKHSVTANYRQRLAEKIIKSLKKLDRPLPDPEQIQRFIELDQQKNLNFFSEALSFYITESKHAMKTMVKIKSHLDVPRWMTFLQASIVSPQPGGNGYEMENLLDIDEMENLRLEKVSETIDRQLKEHTNIADIVFFANDSHRGSYHHLIDKMTHLIKSKSLTQSAINLLNSSSSMFSAKNVPEPVQAKRETDLQFANNGK